MEKINNLELRARYILLSKKLLAAAEEGRSEEELEQLHQQLKELETSFALIDNKALPDCP